MLARQYRSDVWSDEAFAESQLNKQWSERMADLLRIESLRDNWDGEGAEAPLPELVDSLVELLSTFRAEQTAPPPSRVVASPIGSVVIEWQLEDNVYAELECSEPYRAEWMLEVPNEQTTHWPQSWEPPSSPRRNDLFAHLSSGMTMSQL